MCWHCIVRKARNYIKLLLAIFETCIYPNCMYERYPSLNQQACLRSLIMSFELWHWKFGSDWNRSPFKLHMKGQQVVWLKFAPNKKKNAKSVIDPGIESFNSINELCLNLNFIITQSRQYLQKMKLYRTVSVGLTVRYEMMKLCTGSVKHRQTLKNRATQLFRSGSGALVTQFLHRKLRAKRAHMLQSW